MSSKQFAAMLIVGALLTACSGSERPSPATPASTTAQPTTTTTAPVPATPEPAGDPVTTSAQLALESAGHHHVDLVMGYMSKDLATEQAAERMTASADVSYPCTARITRRVAPAPAVELYQTGERTFVEDGEVPASVFIEDLPFGDVTNLFTGGTYCDQVGRFGQVVGGFTAEPGSSGVYRGGSWRPEATAALRRFDLAEFWPRFGVRPTEAALALATPPLPLRLLDVELTVDGEGRPARLHYRVSHDRDQPSSKFGGMWFDLEFSYDSVPVVVPSPDQLRSLEEGHLDKAGVADLKRNFAAKDAELTAEAAAGD